MQDALVIAVPAGSNGDRQPDPDVAPTVDYEEADHLPLRAPVRGYVEADYLPLVKREGQLGSTPAFFSGRAALSLEHHLITG